MKTSIALLLALCSVCAVAGCGGGGGAAPVAAPVSIVQPGPGPGDQANYFPTAIGNSWQYQGVETVTGQTPTAYYRTATVTGTRLVSGITATVVRVASSLDGGSTYEEYLYKAGNGVFSYGSNDPADPVSSQVAPYPELLFPVQTGSEFLQYSRTGLDSGVDLDGDGVNDRVRVTASTAVAGFENVTIPIGSFPAALHLVQTARYTFVLSRSGRPISAAETVDVYLASGVGIIRQSQAVSIPAASYTLNATEELSGYVVDGQGKGLVAEATLATAVAPADSNTYSPGMPSAAFDGTNYLVVSQRVAGMSSTVRGTIVTPANEAVTSFDIGPGDANNSVTGVAFGGGCYMVAYSQNGLLVTQRVTPAGTVLDAPGAISVAAQPWSNFAPAIAFDGTNFLVVWQQYTTQYDIQAALVSPAGAVLKEFTLFTATGEQVFPAIAFDGSNYLVAWRDTRSGSGPAADTDIYAARVQPDGTVLAPSGIPVSTAPGYQGAPRLAFNNGRYLVTWEDFRSGSAAVYAARVGMDGSLLDGPAATGGIAVDTGHSSAYGPVAAPFGNYFVLAWTVGGYGAPAGIYGARLDAAGQLVTLATGGTTFPISGSPSGTTERFVNPVLAPGNGSALIAWVLNREAAGSAKDLLSAVIYPF